MVQQVNRAQEKYSDPGALKPTVFKMAYVDQNEYQWLVASVHYLTEQVDQLKQNGHIGEAAVRDLVPLDAQIEGYQPALLSSFNRGLGTQHSRAILADAISRVCGPGLSQYDLKAAQYQLQRFVSGKDADPVLGRLREYLKKRVEQLFGFDGSSDKDLQFDNLNQLAYLLIVMQKELRTKKLKAGQFVDSLLIATFGDRIREIIEVPEKILICPSRRCRVERSYAKDKQEGYILCLSCGRRILEKEAVFKVRIHKIDGRYLATVKRLLAHPAK